MNLQPFNRQFYKDLKNDIVMFATLLGADIIATNRKISKTQHFIIKEKLIEIWPFYRI